MFSRVHPAMRIHWANKHFSSAVGVTTVNSTSRIYRSIVDNSRGLTLIGGTLFLVIGETAAFVHKQVETAKNIELLDLKTAKNIELLEKNIELVEKSAELVEKSAELAALKNTLLFGQSEEYKSMRDSYAKREVEAASGARGKQGN
jgi:hypothetical protein